MLYHFYEWNHAAMAPLRAVADVTRLIYQNPLNPLSHTQAGRTIAALAEVFERSTRVYGKPEFGLHETFVGGLRVPVADRPVWVRPFCRLLHFERQLPAGRPADPRFLIVAPMSGHYATLLRGTVEALLPYGEVYITDWTDARTVPVAAGKFDLDDYVDYVIEMLHFLGPDTHVIGVCQPAVPVLMATARMEMEEDECYPSSMTLMGGPIDTRINPTGVNKLAEERGIAWFRENVVMKVPFPHAGFMRDVYPGFLQLSGFMSMNLDRHMTAHKDFFFHLVKDDGDNALKHREFYDEYMAVMDLTAEFYLQTVEEVFIKHSLPKGEIRHRGLRLDLSKIRRTALLTVEGENDDISGVGQTKAAQTLCSSIPEDMRVHYMQPKVGHYGVFNGSRFRAEIAPRIVDFALTHGRTHGTAALSRKSGAAPHAFEPAVAETVEDGVVEVEAFAPVAPIDAMPQPVEAGPEVAEASFADSDIVAVFQPQDTGADEVQPQEPEVVVAPEPVLAAPPVVEDAPVEAPLPAEASSAVATLEGDDVPLQVETEPVVGPLAERTLGTVTLADVKEAAKPTKRAPRRPATPGSSQRPGRPSRRS